MKMGNAAQMTVCLKHLLFPQAIMTSLVMFIMLMEGSLEGSHHLLPNEAFLRMSPFKHFHLHPNMLED